MTNANLPHIPVIDFVTITRRDGAKLIVPEMYAEVIKYLEFLNTFRRRARV